MARRQAFRIKGKVPMLAGFPMRVKVAALPEIVKSAAEHVQDVAPKGRGYASSKSIVSRIKGYVDLTGQQGIVKAGAPHSHLLEFGVGPHSLAGKKRKKGHAMTVFGDPSIIRRGANPPGTNAAGPFWHPGIGARPFMQRGLDAAQGDIEIILQREAEKQFEEYLKSVDELLSKA